MKDDSIVIAGMSRTPMGCVLPAGLGQAPARQAALGAGLNQGVPCVTASKMCGSGTQAVMQAHDALKAGSHNVMIAGRSEVWLAVVGNDALKMKGQGVRVKRWQI